MLPNFMDLFEWSIPFLCEKVTEMLYHVFITKHPSTPKVTNEPDVVESKKSNVSSKIIETDVLKNKLKSILLMLKMFKTLRKENEDILKLKGLCPDNKLPKGLLLGGASAIKDAIEQFAKAKEMDKNNEMWPDDCK